MLFLIKRAHDFFKSYKKYEEHLTHHKRLTFNRMITLAVTHLKEKPDGTDEYKIPDC